jgi:hypothetical protein
MVEQSAEPGLTRYWFEFEYEEGSPGWHRGPVSCGVTAFDVDDAKRLITDAFFTDLAFPKVSKLVEDVDVSTIEFPSQAYKSLNYAPPIWRGVWYPLLKSL